MSGYNRKPRKGRVSSSGTSSSGSSSRNPFAGGTPITPRDTGSTDPLYRDPHGSSGVRNDAVVPSSSIDKLLAQSGESNVLGNLGKNTDPNGFLQMLLNIGADNIGVSPDVQKALYDMYLQYLMKQEQRGYDESQLANERLYTSPTNQLARLMGAGISRDAAIQMLNGTGSSDSPLIGSGSDISAPNTGLSPTEKTNMFVGNIISGISAISGLVSLGFSVPQAIQQTKFLSNQNILTDKQISAFENSGTAFKILSSAGAVADSFGSATSAASAISQLAKDGNTDAQQFIANGGVQSMLENAPFTSQTLHNLYMSERSSSDHAKMFSQQVDLNDAELALKEVDRKKVIQEICNLGEEFQKIQADTQFVQGQKALLNWHERLLGSQAKFTTAQAESVELENELTRSVYDTEVDGQSGLQIMTAERAHAAYIQMKTLIEQKDSKLWEDEINSMAKNYQLLSDVYTLRMMHARGESAWLEQNPNFAAMCDGMQSCGAWSYIDKMIQVNSSSNSFKFGPFSISSSGTNKLGAIQFYGHTKGTQYKMKFNDWKAE